MNASLESIELAGRMIDIAREYPDEVLREALLVAQTFTQSK